MDVQMGKHGLLPGWYVQLRFTLSVVATTAMLFTFIYYAIQEWELQKEQAKKQKAHYGDQPQ